MKKKSILALVAAVALSIVIAATCVGCGGGNGGTANGITKINFAAIRCDEYLGDPFRLAVKTYNEGQGKTDGVFVEADYETSTLPGLANAVKGTTYNVIGIENKFYKRYAVSDNFTVLETPDGTDNLLTDELKTRMDWNEIPQSLIDQYRFTEVKDKDTGKFYAGEGQELIGLPVGSNLQVLFYNEDLFAKAGINIISVEEEALAAFNTAHTSSIKPHGYAEYTTDYFADSDFDWKNKTSKNEKGADVIKVFNNRIPMNWDEQRCLARGFMNNTFAGGKACTYGYMSEWWFNYGWSVGGDCIGWNETKGEYEFTIGDKNPNWLAIDDVTVNGRAYKKGKVLDYEDATYINKNTAAPERSSLYALPSMYDAFVEFNRLGVPKDKTVVEGKNGYGLAQPDVNSTSRYFTAGTSPMLNNTFINGVKFSINYNIAPLCQYREYVDAMDGEYLPVIDGITVIGDLKTASNGTPIKGEPMSAMEADSFGVFMPRNANKDKAAREASVKFMAWLAGPQAQAILAKSNCFVPNQTNLGQSEEFVTSSDRKCSNSWAASFATEHCWYGDWTYFEDNSWISNWSTPLNSDVRNGSMTLTRFLENYTTTANNALAAMRIKTRRP